MYTSNGRWKHDGPAWSNWSDGFLPGIMWIFHKRAGGNHAKDSYWMEHAIQYTKTLEPRKHDREAPDLGFIFLSTYYRWYQLARDPKLKEVLIEAGKTRRCGFRKAASTCNRPPARARSSSTS
jgi:unsaturated chondroitin disaccharide hydrolase